MGPIIFILFFPAIIQCYPKTATLDLPVKRENREETMFPNGTVAGKYSYVDMEGNPVEVKYYADNTNYGVELKSVKMLDENLQKVQFSKAKIEFSTSDLPTNVPPESYGIKNQWPFEINFPSENKQNIPNDFLDEKRYLKSYLKGGKPGDNDLAQYSSTQYPQTRNVRKEKTGVHLKTLRKVRKISHFYKEP